MTMGEVVHVVLDMSNALTWLKKCVKEFDVTIVGDEYSLIDYIHQNNYLIKQ